MEIRSLLARQRVSEQFGLNKKSVKPEINKEEIMTLSEPDDDIQDVAEEPKVEAISRFVETEKKLRIKEARNLIQEEVNKRMSETENEQFDIDWDDANTESDLQRWRKTLIKFGRNTKEIDSIFKELEEIDNG